MRTAATPSDVPLRFAPSEYLARRPRSPAELRRAGSRANPAHCGRQELEADRHRCVEPMHASEHSILERLAGDIVERWQDEKVNRRNRLSSDKALQDRHHPGAIKAAPIERLARKSKRRLDVVERDQVSGRRSIGSGVADEFGHAGFNPPIVRDFKLGREARERDSHEPMVAETKHMIKVIIIHFTAGRSERGRSGYDARRALMISLQTFIGGGIGFAFGPLDACRIGANRAAGPLDPDECPPSDLLAGVDAKRA